MAKVNEKFVFIFLYLNISTFILYYVQNLTIWIKKQRIILTVASKHFGHMMFYAADVKSGSIR